MNGCRHSGKPGGFRSTGKGEIMERQKKGRRLSAYQPDYVVFDLETTGLSPVTDRIIEVSAVKVKGGVVKDTFSTLVNPGCPIPAAASRINGITDAMVAGAPGIQEVLGQFLAFIGGEVLVGHNIHSFDMKFLNCAMDAFYKRELGNDYIDTLYMARQCVKELPRHRLVDLAAFFQVSTEGAHRALQDCIMNQKCFEEMGKRMAAAGPEASREPAAEACPRCGGELVKRSGRYGPFYGCSNYPRCRYTRDAG